MYVTTKQQQEVQYVSQAVIKRVTNITYMQCRSVVLQYLGFTSEPKRSSMRFLLGWRRHFGRQRAIGAIVSPLLWKFPSLKKEYVLQTFIKDGRGIDIFIALSLVDVLSIFI